MGYHAGNMRPDWQSKTAVVSCQCIGYEDRTFPQQHDVRSCRGNRHEPHISTLDVFVPASKLELALAEKGDGK